MATIRLTSADVRRFDAAIAAACLVRSPRPIAREAQSLSIRADASMPEYFYSDRKLVMSFDVEWNPFLVNSRGHNDDENRWFVPFGGRVVDEVTRVLKASKEATSEPSGGRVFLTAEGVTRKPSKDELTLLLWTLDGGSLFLK